MKSNHIFALQMTGTPLPAHLFNNNILPQRYAIRDSGLVYRLARVLRCAKDQPLQLFDAMYVANVRFVGAHKEEVTVIIDSVAPLVALKPSIAVVMPALKRDAFHDALYTCVELGANAIFPVMTEKAHVRNAELYDVKRMQAVMGAAAEQSKQFVVPVIAPMKPLNTFLSSQLSGHHKIYLDPAGSRLLDVVNQVRQHALSSIVLAFGPEGDFTAAEKTMLQLAGFQPCALTPTVLRAQQALAVSLGALRSVLS